MLGFPIRKSWCQRPVIDSTRLIADSHVLLRLPMPRHPPCALRNLQTHNHTNPPKMDQPAAHIKSKLYMSIMFSRKPAPQEQSLMMRVYQNCYTCRTNINMFAPQDARVHYAVPKQQPQPTPTNQVTRPDRVVAGRTTKTNKPPPKHLTRAALGDGPVDSGPNSVPNPHPMFTGTHTFQPCKTEVLPAY